MTSTISRWWWWVICSWCQRRVAADFFSSHNLLIVWLLYYYYTNFIRLKPCPFVSGCWWNNDDDNSDEISSHIAILIEKTILYPLFLYFTMKIILYISSRLLKTKQFIKRDYSTLMSLIALGFFPCCTRVQYYEKPFFRPLV